MSLLYAIWERWKIIAHAIGVFQSKVLLTIFYFIFLLPFGLIFSLKKNKSDHGWIEKKIHQNTVDDLKQQ